MDEALEKLKNYLDHLGTEYEDLSRVMHLEREFLITADIDELGRARDLKEALLSKINKLEVERIQVAEAVGEYLGLKDNPPRLLQIVAGLKSVKRNKEADQLLGYHQSLEAQLKSVQEQNKENEVYALKALEMIQGAVGNIKDSLSGKKTYHRSGSMKSATKDSGNFVSKEV